MATINGIYVFVKDESVNRSVESSTHPVEKGIDITDHVKPEAVTLSLNGKVVGENAAEKLSRIYALMNKGALISYVGRNTLSNAQILSFNTTHPNTVWGGFEFDMQIKQVKIAKPAYQASSFTATRKSTGTQQKQTNTTASIPIYHVVKKGDSTYSVAQEYNVTIPTVALGVAGAAGTALADIGNLIGQKILIGDRS